MGKIHDPESDKHLGSATLGRMMDYSTFLLTGVAVELLSWLLTLLLSELFSSSGSLLPDRTPRTSGRPELCRILNRKIIVKQVLVITFYKCCTVMQCCTLHCCEGVGKRQCCGSIAFWCGSGSADPCLWLKDPDPSIFVIELQDANKKLAKKIFCFLLFKGTCTPFFKDPESDPDPYIWLMDPGPDQGGPKQTDLTDPDPQHGKRDKNSPRNEISVQVMLSQRRITFLFTQNKLIKIPEKDFPYA